LEELILIRKTLARQALRLRGLEISLHHVLSKVVFLSDADVHAPGRFSSKADPLTELSERLNTLLKRLNQEDLDQHYLKACQENSSRLLKTSQNQTLQKDVRKVKGIPKVGTLLNNNLI